MLCALSSNVLAVQVQAVSNWGVGFNHGGGRGGVSAGEHADKKAQCGFTRGSASCDNVLGAGETEARVTVSDLERTQGLRDASSGIRDHQSGAAEDKSWGEGSWPPEGAVLK